MSNRQSTVSVRGANIGDQSRVYETRSCLFWYLCSGVYICTDMHTKYSTHCIVFVPLIKISKLYIISKSHGRAVQKTDYNITVHVLQQTMYCCTAQVSQGLLLSAFKVGRVKRGRVHFCILSSKSTSVLIYILNTVHSAVLYHF